MAALPPVLLYAFGAILIVFGTLRAYLLGWSRRAPSRSAAGGRWGEQAPRGGQDGPAEGDEPGEPEDVETRRTGYSAKKHLTWGLVWIGLGLFVVVSTAMQSRGS